MKLPSVLVFLMTWLIGRAVAEDALYLHLFTPTYGQKIDPSPGEEPATPPARVITLKVTAGSDFEAMFTGDNSVSGRITPSGDSVEIKLKGSCGSGFSFDGKVGLDQIFEPDVSWFSGVVFRYKCVVSRQKEIETFLKTQAAADARRLEEATQRTRENKRKFQEEERRKAE
ncbi:MAG: hypothetical protein EOP88_03280 [Verrucomicrobiaceae bacterium]|nr:MAG: hypothetical protein EOP88_03280 [Verrucomicrobiaceae bacterium]